MVVMKVCRPLTPVALTSGASQAQIVALPSLPDASLPLGGNPVFPWSQLLGLGPPPFSYPSCLKPNILTMGPGGPAGPGGPGSTMIWA